MPLTLQTIEELEKRLERSCMSVINLDSTIDETALVPHIKVDALTMSDILSAAKWALERGYGKEISHPKHLDVGEDWGMGETKPGD